MKKIVTFIVMVSLLLSFAACSSDEETAISDGTYILSGEENEEFAPSVIIHDGTFAFTFDLLSSYYNSGSYTLEGDILTLVTDDEEKTYQFKIKGDALVFDEKKSSSVKLIDEQMGVQLIDGDMFYLAK